MKTGSDLNNNARGGNHGIDGINIALRLLLLYLLSCALGFVYYWICEIPIIFVVVPLGYGMVAGYLAWAVLVKPLKVTKRALIILLSCVVGVMALLMSWTWSVFYISESGDFVLNPLKLHSLSPLQSQNILFISVTFDVSKLLRSISDSWEQPQNI